MGNPNEPTNPDPHSTESFAHPFGQGPGQPPLPPTENFTAQGPGQSSPGAPSRWRTAMTGTRRTVLLTAIAALAVGGIAGGLIGWASSGDSSTATTNTSQSTPLQGDKHQSASAGKKHRAATAGTITAVNGGSWTVATRDGRQVTVQIGSSTEFGTSKKPQQQSDFAVGDHVVIAGKDNSGTITATRVVKRVAKQGASDAPSSSVPNATTQPS